MTNDEILADAYRWVAETEARVKAAQAKHEADSLPIQAAINIVMDATTRPLVELLRFAALRPYQGGESNG